MQSWQYCQLSWPSVLDPVVCIYNSLSVTTQKQVKSYARYSITEREKDTYRQRDRAIGRSRHTCRYRNTQRLTHRDTSRLLLRYTRTPAQHAPRHRDWERNRGRYSDTTTDRQTDEYLDGSNYIAITKSVSVCWNTVNRFIQLQNMSCKFKTNRK